MSRMITETRYAVRLLLKSPAFSLVVVLVLALGIGANTAIFSVVNGVLLRSLPYKNPDELVLAWEIVPRSGFDFLPTNERNYLVWKESNPVFSDVTGFRVQNRTLTGESTPEGLVTVACDSALFSTLGVTLRLGRGWSTEEDLPGAAAVAVLSDALWRNRFGQDPEIVGQSIRLDGVQHTILGVFGPTFRFPPPLQLLGGMYEFDADVFVPAGFAIDGSPERNVVALGRLRKGLTLARARSEVEIVPARILEELPGQNPDELGAVLAPVHSQAIDHVRKGLGLLQGAVGLVLLIACVNVANLILVRASRRGQEMSVRMALGATRRDLVRQLLLESLLLAAIAGCIGTLAAHWSLGPLLRVSAGHVPQMAPIGIDLLVLAFTVGVTLLTGILFGLAPALQASRTDLSRHLKEEGRSDSMRGGRRAFRSLLVVSEVGLAVLLLVGASLLIKSLWKVQQVDVGFQAENGRVFNLQLPESRYPNDSEVQRFYSRLLEEFAQLPQVESVGAISGLPLSGDRYGSYVEVEGLPTVTLEDRLTRMTGLRITTPGYFEAMRIPLLEGRYFRADDSPESLQVAVIDRALADRFWPDGDALGSRVTFDEDSDPGAVWRRIVGIVENVRQENLEQVDTMRGTVYYPLGQYSFREMSVVVRTPFPAETADEQIRGALSLLDPELPVRSQSLTSLVRSAESSRRSPAILIGTFATLAVLLSVVGLYGVVSFLVRQRTSEIGVRMALGARETDILKMVGLENSIPVLSGIAFGLGSAMILSHAMSDQLYEVSPMDPQIYVAVTLLFAIVSAASAYLPARRASRLDPLSALRRG